ncbi:hypothetical protein [Sphaerisporangium sp. TRM90804]|uniref:hypothetical protein n=1 Tax=Sphaerisporangium sp. TRM90804 TaxID=3031113 RepID=UPI00244A5161|nr:hypothetical protein [Sphaerisporangium sp. TRM90804]MDH2424043.1 hypothetical protein [Sphaerisporangium sp. TRM90804]
MDGAQRATAFAIAVTGLLACGCSPGAGGVAERPAARAPGEGSPTAAGVACEITRPSDRRGDPPAGVGSEGDDRWFGEGPLWASLPDPGYGGERRANGYAVKIGWWRLTEGGLRVTAEPLGSGSATTPAPAAAPTASVEVRSGYEPTGFQPSLIVFSGTGCWRVTGTLARQAVSFVMRVEG